MTPPVPARPTSSVVGAPRTRPVAVIVRALHGSSGDIAGEVEVIDTGDVAAFTGIDQLRTILLAAIDDQGA